MDILTDLSNNLLWCDVWDPHNINSLHANKIKVLTYHLLDKNIPLKHEKEEYIVVSVDP